MPPEITGSDTTIHLSTSLVSEPVRNEAKQLAISLSEKGIIKPGEGVVNSASQVMMLPVGQNGEIDYDLANQRLAEEIISFGGLDAWTSAAKAKLGKELEWRLFSDNNGDGSESNLIGQNGQNEYKVLVSKPNLQPQLQ